MKKLDITLVTANRDADLINEDFLKKLPGDEFTFYAEVFGTGETMLKNSLVERVLKLKVGSQIMFLKNLRSGVVNGLMGFVKEINLGDTPDKTVITVETEEGKIIKVKRETWKETAWKKESKAKNAEYYEYFKGKFVQFPIRLANAFSIHKSQGLTFNEVKFNRGSGTFATGQLYVALSRCRTMEGLTLTDPIRFSDVEVNKRALSFYRKCVTDKRYLRCLYYIEHNMYVPEDEEEEEKTEE